MKLPLQITFRHMERSDSLTAAIEEKAEKLDRFSDQIMACRVVIESPHQHHNKGQIFEVRVDLTVPGGEIVASRDAGLNHAHEDVYVALRDAFSAVTRQLEDYVRKQQRKVKLHEAPPHGRISRLIPEEDHGFIETQDGREVYFHRNSVLQEAFETLEVGSEVRYAEENGDAGPQASTVALIGKHHIVE